MGRGQWQVGPVFWPESLIFRTRRHWLPSNSLCFSSGSARLLPCRFELPCYYSRLIWDRGIGMVTFLLPCTSDVVLAMFFFCARTRHSKCRCCQGIKYGFSIGALCSPSMGPSLSLQIHHHGSVGSQRVLSDVSTKHKIHCEGSQRSGFSGRRCGRSLTACNIIACRSDVVTCGLLGEELP